MKPPRIHGNEFLESLSKIIGPGIATSVILPAWSNAAASAYLDSLKWIGPENSTVVQLLLSEWIFLTLECLESPHKNPLKLNLTKLLDFTPL